MPVFCVLQQNNRRDAAAVPAVLGLLSVTITLPLIVSIDSCHNAKWRGLFLCSERENAAFCTWHALPACMHLMQCALALQPCVLIDVYNG